MGKDKPVSPLQDRVVLHEQPPFDTDTDLMSANMHLTTTGGSMGHALRDDIDPTGSALLSPTTPSDVNTATAITATAITATQPYLKPTTSSSLLWTVRRELNQNVEHSYERTAASLKSFLQTVLAMPPTKFAQKFRGLNLDQENTTGEVVAITDPTTGKTCFVHQISFRVTRVGDEPANRDDVEHCETLHQYPIEGIVQSLYSETAKLLFTHLTAVRQMRIQYQGPNNEVVDVATPEEFVNAMDEMKANNLPINFIKKPKDTKDMHALAPNVTGSLQPSSQQTSFPETSVMWEFESNDGQYKSYNAHDSHIIEAEFVKRSQQLNRCVDPVFVSNGKHKVFIHDMTQENVNTAFVRMIRRKQVELKPQHVNTQSHTHCTTATTFTTSDVERTSPSRPLSMHSDVVQVLAMRDPLFDDYAITDPAMHTIFLDHLRNTIMGALNHTPTANVAYWEQQSDAIVAVVDNLERQANN